MFRKMVILLEIFYNKFRPIQGKGNVCTIKGVFFGKKSIIGNDNYISICKDCFVNDMYIRIRGNNNKLIIEDGVVFRGLGNSIWLEGNNNTIHIHKKTTFTRNIHLNAQERDVSIEIGEECMFSNTIIVRTSDSHPIYNEKGERINLARSVVIGNHVWIAPSSTIMKGTIIGDNSIIGSNSVVTGSIPANCLAVGMPAKVVKTNIVWDRKDVIFN